MELDDIIGLRVAWEDMANCKRGIIFACKHAERRQFIIGAGGLRPIGFVVSIVWDDGTISRESPLDGWRLLPTPRASQDEITQALHDADQLQAAKEREKAAEKAENASIRGALPSLHPHLITAKSKPDWNDGRVAAENIRRELRKAWPGVRFSVRFRTFSGGDSIDVGWTDGPTSAQVNGVIGKYQYGWFDGMTDCYEHSKESDRTWGDVFGSAKYVHAQRSSTQDAVRKAWAAQGFNPADVPAEADYRVPGWDHMIRAWSETAF